MQRHDDIEVLCAVMDTCYYKVQHSESIYVHEIQMNIKNTGKQYLRIRIPETANVLTAKVDGKVVKPAAETKETERFILLGLSKST